MKTMRISRIAWRCGAAALFLWAAFPRPMDAQIIYPGPAVRIISPANHAVFFAPVDIPIFAYVDSHLLYAPAEVALTNVEWNGEKQQFERKKTI